jgi:hypothetical protein
MLARLRFPSRPSDVLVGLLIAWTGFVIPCWAQPDRINLVEDARAWSVGTDRAGATMSLAEAKTGLAVAVTADGGEEDYPKARIAFAQPQDWRCYARLNLRLRVACTDPGVREKHIALVFYAEQTR